MSALRAERRGLALFDLDHTLLPIDSDHAWNDFVVDLGWVDAAAFKAGNDAFYADYQAGRLDIHAYIAFATAPLRERTADALQQAHARFMRDVIAPSLRPEAHALVESHRSRGDALVVVTSTNDFITAPIAAAFGIETLIATALGREAATGAFNGRIEGVPSFRRGKVERVRQWLEAGGRTWSSFDRVSAYSDSDNDLPLLEAATDPVATNPSPALERIARERGWRILNLFA